MKINLSNAVNAMLFAGAIAVIAVFTAPPACTTTQQASASATLTKLKADEQTFAKSDVGQVLLTAAQLSVAALPPQYQSAATVGIRALETGEVPSLADAAAAVASATGSNTAANGIATVLVMAAKAAPSPNAGLEAAASSVAAQAAKPASPATQVSINPELLLRFRQPAIDAIRPPEGRLAVTW